MSGRTFLVEVDLGSAAGVGEGAVFAWEVVADWVHLEDLAPARTDCVSNDRNGTWQRQGLSLIRHP